MSKHNKHEHEEENVQTNMPEKDVKSCGCGCKVDEQPCECGCQNEEQCECGCKERQQCECSEKVKELTEKVEALEDTKLRLMAEFENFRRRTQKEKIELMESAGERIFVDMLPLMDDFERAIAAMKNAKNEPSEANQNDSLAEGVELIYQKFLAFLQQHDVTTIETEDKEFSTDEHEAITTLDMGKEKQGKIIDCTQKGYKLGDKVIRYAKVVVGA